FFANFAGKTPPHHRLRRLAGTESGELCIAAIVAGHTLVGLGDFVGRHINRQLARAFRIENGAVLVIMTFMIVMFVAVVVVIVFMGSRTSRVGLGVVF